MENTKRFIVQDREYEATKMGGESAKRIWLRILKFVAPIFSEGVTFEDSGSSEGEGEGEEGKKKVKVDLPKILKAVAGAVQNLPEEDMDLAWKLAAQSCREVRTGKLSDGSPKRVLMPIDFDSHFRGRMVGATLWLKEILEFNFGADFLALGQTIKSTLGGGNSALEESPETPREDSR